MHRKKVFGWILVRTIFSSAQIHFLVFFIKFHTGVDWAPNFRNIKKKINTQQSVWHDVPSQHNHWWPQLQCFEDNVLALLGRVRIEQDQGWRVRNTETTKSMFSARQINTNKLQFQDILPIRLKPRHASNYWTFFYTPNKPPQTRAKQLASSLYHYIT